MSAILDPQQLIIQAKFKEFFKALCEDASKYTEGAIQMKVDIQLGVYSKLQQPKAQEYAIIIQQIIDVAKEVNSIHSIMK